MDESNITYWTDKTVHWLRRVTGLIVFLGWLMVPHGSLRAQAPSLTEHQVKALFLLNFTKYVDWPPDAFADTNAPITIGVLGDDKFDAELKTAVAGKTVNGRAIVSVQLGKDDDCSKCQVVFISTSQKKNLPAILVRLAGRPVLTVGETEQFAQQGVIINFMRKDGKVRLEIDLDAARSAKLHVSSQLLKVADTVRGKP